MAVATHRALAGAWLIHAACGGSTPATETSGITSDSASASAGVETSDGTGDASTSLETTTAAPEDTGGDALAGCFHRWTFDDCGDDWEVGKADAGAAMPPGWICGDPPEGISLQGAHTGVWATSLDGEYTEDQSSYLASPSFSLANCAGATIYLSFAHLYQFGSGDGGSVQLSTDGGASWTTIAPTWHGYCDGVLDVPWAPPGGEPGFCEGDKDAWIHSVIALDAYGGESDVRVRFVFGSDGIIEQAGWYIDSVSTEAY